MQEHLLKREFWAILFLSEALLLGVGADLILSLRQTSERIFLLGENSKPEIEIKYRQTGIDGFIIMPDEVDYIPSLLAPDTKKIWGKP